MLAGLPGRLARRAPGWLRAAALATALTSVPACTEWLEVDEEGDEVFSLPVGEPVILPSVGAQVGGEGPLVPQTPGLRVPLAGYWTRARLDALDVVFPYTWASLLQAEVATPGRPGERPGQLVLRLEGTAAPGDESTPTLGLRAVMPLPLPPGTDLSAVRSGFDLGAEALAGATVGLRTYAQDLWLVTLTRLRLETVTPRIVVGTLEGEAKRGARGQRPRVFRAAFIALRVPP